MKLLLDTHTAIWFVTDNKQLPKSSKQLIENPDNHCFISIATLWEMGIKYSLGKLKLKAELNKIFELFFLQWLNTYSNNPRAYFNEHHLTISTSRPF
jgi:PIN domain nuclease of toxin-antitoxin system